MKKILILLALVAFAKIGYGQAASTEVAAFKWSTQEKDFGKIKQGVPVSHEFKFTNTGKVPLIITNVQASCGCTTPDWTRDPVPPGQSGIIKATFSAAASGVFDKSVTATANVAGGSAVLKIHGEVVPNVP